MEQSPCCDAGLNPAKLNDRNISLFLPVSRNFANIAKPWYLALRMIKFKTTLPTPLVATLQDMMKIGMKRRCLMKTYGKKYRVKTDVKIYRMRLNAPDSRVG